MKCPACGSDNPLGASRCTCGHELTTESTPTSGVRGLSFHGEGGALFGIYIVNLLLTIVTLGVFYFWGKTRIRRYMYSQAAFDGDRLTYHGTGMELLIGWLKAVLVFGLLYAVLFGTMYRSQDPVAIAFGFGVFYIGFLLLIPVAIVGARRYRLSRTSWRGIRFSFRGHMVPFVKLYVAGLLLTIVTLGIYSPYFDTRVRAFLTRHAQFGNEAFDFDGQGDDLLRRYLLALLLFIPTLGIYWFWYRAERQRYFWACTSFGGVRFRSTVTGGGLFALNLVNGLLTMFTLGLAVPWVLVRTARYVFDNLSLEGDVDLAAIEQDARLGSATGEGLSDILETDMGLDLGV